MKPYKMIKLTEGPDVGDIIFEGRASRVGGKNYNRNTKAKSVNRRYLKRINKKILDIIDTEEVK